MKEGDVEGWRKRGDESLFRFDIGKSLNDLLMHAKGGRGEMKHL